MGTTIGRRLHHIFWEKERVLCALIELAEEKRDGRRVPLQVAQYRYYACFDQAWVEFFPPHKRDIALCTWAVVWPLSYLRRMQIPVLQEFKSFQEVVFNGEQPDDPRLLQRPRFLRAARALGTCAPRAWQPVLLPINFA